MKKRWSRFLTAVGLTGALTLFNLSVPRDDKPSDEGRQPVKTEKPAIKPDTVKTPIRNAVYFTDTLYQSTSTLMYYKADKIYRNYVDNNNLFKLQMQYVVHEDWHKHNYYCEFRYKYDYSPMEYCMLCMHDEISANLAAILSLRYEYLSSPDKAAVIAKYENTYAGFYFKAIKEGKINPESTNPAENEQEWIFLANGTRDMWMQTFAKQYSPNILKMMYFYIQKKGICPSNPKNYNAVKKYMYNIGGIDFNKYMNADIECPDIRPKIVDNLSKVNSFKNEKKDFVEEVVKNIPLLDSISPNLRATAMQHILIAAKLKTTIANEKNPVKVKSIITTQYNQLMYNMQHDITLNNFITNYSLNEFINNPEVQGERNYRELINEIYTYKGVKLNKFIPKFSVNRVPQTTHFYNKFFQQYTSETSMENLLNMYDETLPIDSLRFEEPLPVGEVNQSRRRLSGELTMAIPNFRDPILTSMTAVQRDSLYQMIQDFENMPAVLKSCNTKEIEKYKREYTNRHHRQKNIPYAVRKKRLGSTR